MARTDRRDRWAQTNSLLLLGIVDLLEEKELLDKDQFLERLATFKEESIDIGLFWNSEDELRKTGYWMPDAAPADRPDTWRRPGAVRSLDSTGSMTGSLSRHFVRVWRDCWTR